MINPRSGILLSAVAIPLVIASCAPTTGSFEGSTDTFGNTSEASSKFTSSTSPSGSGDAKEEQVEQFARVNFIRLRSDMAVGEGEYLSSMAILMEIDESKRDDFFLMTKNNFDQIFISSETTPDELVVNLRKEIALL